MKALILAGLMLGLLSSRAHAEEKIWVVIGCQPRGCEEMESTETHQSEIFATESRCETIAALRKRLGGPTRRYHCTARDRRPTDGEVIK
jgi:hypothetical protein